MAQNKFIISASVGQVSRYSPLGFSLRVSPDLNQGVSPQTAEVLTKEIVFPHFYYSIPIAFSVSCDVFSGCKSICGGLVLFLHSNYVRFKSIY